MKYLFILLLIFLSAAVFSQNKDTGSLAKIAITPVKDSVKKVKAAKCRITLAGKLGTATDTTSIDEILADPVVRGEGCDNFTITSFEMVMNIHNTLNQIVSTNDHLTKDMIKLIKQAFMGTPIIIQSVHYKLADGRTGVTPGLILCINK